MELLENHVKLVKAELKRRQGDEFLCKQQEFELVKPHLISNTPEKASLRKSEHNSAKVKQ
jgi:hypothetical protein